MALAKKPLEIFQQVTVKNAEELAGVSAMFAVVRAKSNISRHIQSSPLPVFGTHRPMRPRKIADMADIRRRVNWQKRVQAALGRPPSRHLQCVQLPIEVKKMIARPDSLDRTSPVRSIRLMRTSGVQRWSMWLLVTTMAVVGCYFWVDRPLALFAHDQTKQFDIFVALRYIPQVLTPPVLVAFGVLGLRALNNRPLSRLQTTAVLAAASLAIAELLKVQLEFIFGRTWPRPGFSTIPLSFATGSMASIRFMGARGLHRFPQAIPRSRAR
jgi:hypothetical protein